MSPTRTTIEDEVYSNGLVLSMRAKMCLGGLCFFIVLGSIITWSVPNAVEALRGLAQGEDLVENVSSQTYATVFFDDFDVLNTYSWWEGMFHERDTFGWGDMSLRDGYMFLNITNTTEGVSFANAVKEFGHLYQGVEMRLRCSDDNKLVSDIGGGTRSWGFGPLAKRTYGPELGFYGDDNALCFASYSPESDPPLPGFWAVSRVNGTEIRKPITGVDITEWHTYTIVWVKGHATFLVDGVIVAGIDNTPTQEMFVSIVLNNCVYSQGDWPGGFRYDHLDLPVDESIQVDYVHIFWTDEQLVWGGHTTQELFNIAKKMIETHENRSAVTFGYIDAGKNQIPTAILDEMRQTYNLAVNASENGQESTARDNLLSIIRSVQLWGEFRNPTLYEMSYPYRFVFNKSSSRLRQIHETLTLLSDKLGKTTQEQLGLEIVSSICEEHPEYLPLYDLFYLAAEVINQAEQSGENRAILSGMKANYAAAIRSIFPYLGPDSPLIGIYLPRLLNPESPTDGIEISRAGAFLDAVLDAREQYVARIAEPISSILFILILFISMSNRRKK